MMDRIRTNPADAEDISAPRVTVEASAERVLVMESLEAGKIMGALAFDDVEANLI